MKLARLRFSSGCITTDQGIISKSTDMLKEHDLGGKLLNSGNNLMVCLSNDDQTINVMNNPGGRMPSFGNIKMLSNIDQWH